MTLLQKPDVNPKQVLWSSTVITSVLFFYIGMLGAAAFPYSVNNSTLVSVISQCNECFILTKIGAFYLPVAVFMTSIPVYLELNLFSYRSQIDILSSSKRTLLLTKS